MNRCKSIAAVLGAVVFFTSTVTHAEPGLHARVNGGMTANGGLAFRSAVVTHGERGTTAGQHGIVTDSQGNVRGVAGSAFTLESGNQGARYTKFNRSSDGTVTTTGQASASGVNGSADRSSHYERSADGSASGERNTTITNTNTGVNFDGNTTYNNSSGVNRSVACKDAAGNSVACFSR